MISDETLPYNRKVEDVEKVMRRHEELRGAPESKCRAGPNADLFLGDDEKAVDKDECLRSRHCDMHHPETREVLVSRLERIFAGEPLETGYGGMHGLEYCQVQAVGISGTSGASMAGWHSHALGESEELLKRGDMEPEWQDNQCNQSSLDILKR